MVKFKYFAGKLEEFRSAANMTQADLAEEMGVSQSTVQAWLAGASSPNVTQLNELTDLFRRPSVDELVRPVSRGDEFLVVPKRFLLDALKDAQQTISKTKGTLYGPMRKADALDQVLADGVDKLPKNAAKRKRKSKKKGG